ncbi:hypothetical protein [Pseudarthrobacter sp. NIBRBAC000502770]|nr:hypothetical protein [Pseudarthrobacter sp. NIBRBAC000502770]
MLEPLLKAKKMKVFILEAKDTQACALLHEAVEKHPSITLRAGTP